MIEKIYSSSFFSPGLTFLTGYSPKNQQSANELKADVFCKSKNFSSQNGDAFSLLSFAGKASLAAKAKQTGNMLFTKALKDYNAAVAKLSIPKEQRSQALFNEVSELFGKTSHKLEDSALRLKLGLGETDYAQKANIIGNIFTQMGNVTGDPRYFKRAHDFFEEATNISKDNLTKAQSEFQVYGANEQVLYNVLNPVPKKNPIGFQTSETSQIAAKHSTEKQAIGF